MIFSGMLETGDVEEEGLIDLMPIAHPRFAFEGVTGFETFMIHSVRDHMNPILLHAEESENVFGGGATYSDDLILAACKEGNDPFSVEHPFPIIFFLDMERGKVVNGSHERAIMAPEESAIARHVHQIQPKAPDEAREHGMMPEYVLDGFAPALRNRNELHFVTGEIEQRKIFFEDEEMEGGTLRQFAEGAQHGKEILPNAGVAPLNHGGGKADFHFRSSSSASILESRRTFRIGAGTPVKRTETPRRSACLRVRARRPTPVLSMNRTSERSMGIRSFRPAAATSSVSIWSQTFSALQAVISPRQSKGKL